MTETQRFVVRRFGSDTTHVADIPPGLLQQGRMLGRPFTGAPTPVAAVCGSVLRDGHGMVVCMRAGTSVRCRACRRSSGVSVAGENP